MARPDEFWLQETRPCLEAVPSEPGTAVVALAWADMLGQG